MAILKKDMSEEDKVVKILLEGGITDEDEIRRVYRRVDERWKKDDIRTIDDKNYGR